jgi:hypothetical protein
MGFDNFLESRLQRPAPVPVPKQEDELNQYLGSYSRCIRIQSSILGYGFQGNPVCSRLYHVLLVYCVGSSRMTGEDAC